MPEWHKREYFACLDAGAEEEYTWLQLYLIDLSWQEIEKGECDDPEASHFEPIKPFRELAELLMEKKADTRIELPFSGYLTPGAARLENIGDNVYCRSRDDRDFFYEYPDIFDQRILEEGLAGCERDIESIPEWIREELLDFWDDCVSWIEKHVGEALLKERTRASTKMGYLGTETLDFARNSIVTERLLEDFSRGELSHAVLFHADGQLRHSNLSPQDMYKTCTTFAAFVFRSIAFREIRERARDESTDRNEPEKELVRLGGYPKNYELLLKGRVTVNHSFGIPVFAIRDRNILAFLHDSEHAGGSYRQTHVLAFDHENADDNAETIRHELHHHAYAQFFSALGLKRDAINDEVLAYLFDEGRNLDEIARLLVDPNGLYRYDANEVAGRIELAKTFLDTGMSRRTTAATLLFLPE